MVEILITYILRILPALAALMLFLLLLPRRAHALRITVYIALFIVIRDAMTPVGLWRFGTDAFFWLRFTPSQALLLIIAAGSTLAAVGMLAAEPQLRRRIEWLRRPQERTGPAPLYASTGLAAGLVGALITAAPLLLFYTGVPIGLRGGIVVSGLLPALALTALLGNFYEELLFRGFLQDYFSTSLKLSPLHAALASGAAFAAGHSFLAVTVSSVGAPLLLFALYEGVIAGLIRMRWGLIPAVISHGGAIFLLSGGFV